MQKLIAPACLLLLLSWFVAMERDAQSPVHGLAGELSLLLFSKGASLPVEKDPLFARYGISDGIITDDEVLRFKKPGLRAAVFDRNLKLLAHRNFAVASSLPDIKAFLLLCQQLPERSVLVLQHEGSLWPGQDAPELLHKTLLEQIQGLGAQFNPFSERPASWCFISVRDKFGFHALAESYAADRNANLAWTLTESHLKRPPGKAEVVVMTDTKE